jgi:hypothetical protein
LLSAVESVSVHDRLSLGDPDWGILVTTAGICPLDLIYGIGGRPRICSATRDIADPAQGCRRFAIYSSRAFCLSVEQADEGATLGQPKLGSLHRQEYCSLLCGCAPGGAERTAGPSRRQVDARVACPRPDIMSQYVPCHSGGRIIMDWGGRHA